MIDLQNVPPGTKILELGGGDAPHPLATVNVDVRPGPKVSFAADFNAPLPMQDNEWDVILCQYTLEHISYRNVSAFLKEVFRILKAGGRALFTIPNTEAQLKWVLEHPDGWDGHDFFHSASCVLFGDNDYPENTHRSYFNPTVVMQLFNAAGFSSVVVTPHGERQTDLVVDVRKTAGETAQINLVGGEKVNEPVSVAPSTLITMKGLTREEMFDRAYFCGGGKVGGYAREGMWDFPVHEITANHVLMKRPESVLEIGAARGYILKRLQDAGIDAHGLEISKHCYMTRVCNGAQLHDICKTPWGIAGTGIGTHIFDLAFSIATFEHIPEQFLPAVCGELKRVTKRGLHGIDFGEKDDGFDKTHCSLYPQAWWRDLFDRHGLQSHEIVDKEELEQGQFPAKILKGDGKSKLNIGSFQTMFHHGWHNVDIEDCLQFAQSNGYHYLRQDARKGLPQYKTGTVDLIFLSHMLEHLTFAEGASFLKECRRLLKPSGAMRIIVPDARLLNSLYCGNSVPGISTLADYSEINDECAKAATDAERLWALLHQGHGSCYDAATLAKALVGAGFQWQLSSLHHTQLEPVKQILRETIDQHYELSLFMDAVPA